MKKLLLILPLLLLFSLFSFADREDREEMDRLMRDIEKYLDGNSPISPIIPDVPLFPNLDANPIQEYMISVPNTYVLSEEYRNLGSSIAEIVAEQLEYSPFLQAVPPGNMERPDLLYELATVNNREEHVKAEAEAIGLLCVLILENKNDEFVLEATVYDSRTGELLTEEQIKKKGNVLVLSDMAREIGDQISSSAFIWSQSLATPLSSVKKYQEPLIERPTRVKRKSHTKHFSHLIVSTVLPTFKGSAADIIEDFHDADFGDETFALNGSGIDFHLLIDFRNHLYLGFGVGLLTQEFEWEEGDYTVDDFSVTDLRLTMGGLFPLADAFAVYAGAGLTSTTITLEEYWSFFDMDGKSESGTGFCIEAGADVIFKYFCISPRITYTHVSKLTSQDFFAESQDLSIMQLSIGAGLSL